MKITIRYGEQLFIVDVSENIYLALDENAARLKTCIMKSAAIGMRAPSMKAS